MDKLLYGAAKEKQSIPVKSGKELFSGREVGQNEVLILDKWDLVIIESGAA